LDQKSIILKSGRERSVLRKHPWIYSGAISQVIGDPQAGESVIVQTNEGESVAIAAYSPFSSIRARIWTWDIDQIIDDQFFEKKLQLAFHSRDLLFSNRSTDAYRVVNAESDGLPGLIVDRYRDWLVVQFLTMGVDYWKKVIIAKVKEIVGSDNIYERSDVDIRELECLPQNVGKLGNEEPPELFEIIENDKKFLVDIKKGQKTGFYLDQRDNRQRLMAYAQGRTILNCFSYSGAFAVYGLDADAAEVTSIESSGDANLLAKKNIELNGLDLAKTQWIEADVFQQLRRFRDEGRFFDLIVLDPPKFAPTSAQVQKAARGYKDINLLAFKLLKPGGILFTFSCSGGVPMELFQKIVADSALDAGVEARILEKLHQASDHPIGLNFPEGEYLKGLVCQI
jgi:23S rRNA (cytosine1962-C5)-methyltransferase